MIERRVWVDTVEIADPGLSHRNLPPDAFALSLVEFMQEKGYFRETSLLPGEVEEGDLILRFRFLRLSQSRTRHFSLSSKATDFCAYHATVVVSDASGSVIAEIAHSSTTTRRVPMGEELNVSVFVDSESQFVDRLIEKATAKIREFEASGA
jgi:hypothetical protein